MAPSEIVCHNMLVTGSMHIGIFNPNWVLILQQRHLFLVHNKKNERRSFLYALDKIDDQQGVLVANHNFC